MKLNDRETLRQKVAEIIVVRASGHSLDSLREYPNWELRNSELQRLLEEGVGGVILFGGNVHEIQDRSIQLREWADQPIFLCADVEEGVGQRFQGATWMVPPMSLGILFSKEPEVAISYALQYGVSVGREARESGLNWVLGPVCDVNSNPLNPVINMRAWSTEPEAAALLSLAFHKGLISQGVLSCAKHFPGHGDTTVDSHLEMPILDKNLSDLNQLELIPFRTLIDNGVESVMTAHLLLKQIDPNYPVTFSKTILKDLLRKEMGYKGLIVTDALVMQSITKNYSMNDIAVMAFSAGADILLMPPNPSQAIDSIVDALNSGKIPMQRLEESLQKRRTILRSLASQNSSIFERNDFFSGFTMQDETGSNLAEKLLQSSIEFNTHCKINTVGKSINLIRVDDIIKNDYFDHSSPALSIPEQFGFSSFVTHSLGINPWQKTIDESLNLDLFGEGSFLLQIFIRGNPFQGSQGFQEPWVNTVIQLQQHKRLSGVVVYGSFYLWKDLLTVLEPSVPAAFSPGQMQLAQEKVLQSLFPSNQPAKQNGYSNEFEFTK